VAAERVVLVQAGALVGAAVARRADLDDGRVQRGTLAVGDDDLEEKTVQQIFLR
jgi:hypothetical protein